MAKLHELLAVEKELKGKKDKDIKVSMECFEKHPQMFTGGIKTLQMFDEGRSNEEAAGAEHSEIANTVKNVLAHAFQSISSYWDGRLQKEASNQLAVANIVVGTETIAEKVPVTFLLNLEDELKQVRDLLEHIPTLNASVAWEKHTQKGEDIWKASVPVVKNKTEQAIRHQIVVPAKDNGGHPAQVQTWNENVPVGKYTTVAWSAMMPESDKRKMLVKVTELLNAVKKARQRANCQNIEDRHIAAELLGYILG